jgi:TonB family protein
LQKTKNQFKLNALFKFHLYHPLPMKTKILTLLFTFISIICFSQIKNYVSEKPFQTDKDTLYSIAFEVGVIENLPEIPIIKKSWPEKGKYRVMLFNAKKGYVIQSAWYKDKNLKEPDGIFETFHENGMAKDSGLFEKKAKQGIFKGWYEDGELQYIYHYQNGIKVDTSYELMKDGSLSEITIADKEGNGIFQNYHKNGKIKLLGRVKNGKRDGPFVFKADDGTKIMDIVFLKDSAIQAQCFNTDGVTPLGGECVFERLPEFPGGIKGWSNYLAIDLKYPEFAINRNIQGVVLVQFMVFKDGSIDGLKIISSPDESLSKEVLRLMKNSPRWKPAIRYNEPVLYRHVQGVTFKLQD